MVCKLKPRRVGSVARFNKKWQKSWNMRWKRIDNQFRTNAQYLIKKQCVFVWYIWEFECDKGEKAVMQAALMIRSKQRIARNKLRRQRLGIRGELPTSVATKDIPPYPRFPPESWVGSDFFDTPKVFKRFSLKVHFIINLFNLFICQLINLAFLHL